MFVLFLSLFASFLWASTNHIDKYLISKVTKNGDYKGLMVFSSFLSGLLLFPIFLILSKFNIQIDLLSFIFITGAVISAIGAVVFYYNALYKNDTSLIIAMFQTIPVFSYMLGLVFLKEQLTIFQIVGGLIILLSSILIIFDFKELKFSKGKVIALTLMLGSSMFYASQNLLFRLATKRIDFNVVNSWYNIILFGWGIILLLSKKFRHSFIYLLKNNGKKVFGFNVLNEVLYQIANISSNYAMMLTSIAVVSILSSGMQPVFVFIIGLIGFLLFPRIFNDEEAKKDRIQKISCIIISIIGLVLFYC